LFIVVIVVILIVLVLLLLLLDDDDDDDDLTYDFDFKKLSGGQNKVQHMNKVHVLQYVTCFNEI
jgi:hypothetical protein